MLSHNVNGLNVVVTGKIEGETRQSAEAKLRAAGAHVQEAVTAGTHLLVTGAAVGGDEDERGRQGGRGGRVVVGSDAGQAGRRR